MANNNDTYFGFNKPSVATTPSGQPVRVETTFTRSIQPVQPAGRQLTYAEAQQIAEAIRDYVRRNKR